VIENRKPPKLASSRSILFFGPSLNISGKKTIETQSGSPHEEFTVMNSNEYKIQIKLVIHEDPGSQSFRFILQEKEREKFSLNESGTQMEVSLEPKEVMRVRVKFTAASNYGLDRVLGYIKMNVLGFLQNFNVQLIGFQSQASLQLLENDGRTIEYIFHFEQQQKRI
jgi:hypothetical protein